MDNSIIEFLIEAKKQTYANSEIKKEQSSRLSSKDYHYEKEVDGSSMIYHDTYFGGKKFIGEEVLYQNNTPIWAMNYYGITIDKNLSEEAMDKVLRPALMTVGEDNEVLPIRGPKELEEDEYYYTFKTEGTLENFTGIEEIYKNKDLIYQLKCHGGIIE